LRRQWDLNWRKYPHAEDIDPEGGLATVVVGFEDLDKSKPAAEYFRQWLSQNGFSFEQQRSDPNLTEDPVMVASSGRDTVMFRDDFGYMPIRCPQGKLCAVISDWFASSVHDVAFVGAVDHGTWRFQLKGYGTVTERVGVVTKDGYPNLYPYKFLSLRRNRRLIAKMLVSHYNHEMAEASPTMEMLEVVEEERGKGIGRSMIELVEDKARDDGFEKIWGTDAELSMKLLKRLGYDFDLEDGVKYLWE
jgi:GNAT superfamily N-acetyltransferase